MKRLIAALVFAASAAGAWAQAPAKKAPPAVYDEYQASQRMRLRRESCGRDEDPVAAFCVRRCERGYLARSQSTLPRRCRSLQPLPPGSLSQGVRRQLGTPPVPPKPSNSAPSEPATAG
jgi:hypothetical protein